MVPIANRDLGEGEPGISQRSNVRRVRCSSQNFPLTKSFKNFRKFSLSSPKLRQFAEKLSFILRIWPGNLLMDILRDSQLVSLPVLFLKHFSTKVLQVFSSNSYEIRGGKNRKWRWILHLTAVWAGKAVPFFGLVDYLRRGYTLNVVFPPFNMGLIEIFCSLSNHNFSWYGNFFVCLSIL